MLLALCALKLFARINSWCFSSKEHCSKCKGEVELSQKPLEEYCCLKCGELGLEETEFMDWD